MSENTLYFQTIVAARSKDVDPHDNGATLSLETCPEIVAEHIGTYIKENFKSFIVQLRQLNDEDQELLLSYYLLAKPQWSLALLYRSTQTVCSSKLRMAVKKLGTAALFGDPDIDTLDTVLDKHNLNSMLDGVKTSQLVDTYRQTRSFDSTARIHGVHRPDIRRVLSNVAKELLKERDREELAIGAYIFGLIDKASATGIGFSRRKLDKHTHVYIKDSSILGRFSVDVTHPDFNHMLVSKACT